MNHLRVGGSITVAGLTIIPVENINIYCDANSITSWWYGSKDLYALVVHSSSGLQVFDKHAQEISIDELIGKVPKLGRLLKSLTL